MNAMETSTDVVVVGSGYAALTSALAAWEQGAKVIVLEKAPPSHRGGNSKYTAGAHRFIYSGPKDIHSVLPDFSEEELKALQIPPYSPNQFYDDLMRVTHGLADPDLGEVLAKDSLLAVKWVMKYTGNWHLRATDRSQVHLLFRMAGGILPLEPNGGGEGMMQALFDASESKGIELRYGAKVRKLLVDQKGRVHGVGLLTGDGYVEIHARKGVVLGCGGFEANPEMRTKYLGPQWNLVKVRGTRYNTGEMLTEALAIGAQPVGHWAGAHASAIDVNARNFENGNQMNRYSFPSGIAVNEQGKRFVDEGEDFIPYIYAKMGKLVLEQPNSIAYQIFDAKAVPTLMAEYANAKPIVSDSLRGLEEDLGMKSGTLTKVIEQFNAAATDVPFNPTVLDGKCTVGVDPPKSNWAQKIDTPPFRAYPVVCGITYSYGGLKTNTKAQVLDTEGDVIKGLYAVGEIQGGLYYYNYPGGSGLTKGLVFGRLAGINAAAG